MKAIAASLLLFTTIANAGWTNLWPNEAPGAPQPASGTEKIGEGGRLSDIEIPQYEVHLPDKAKANGAAVLIFPGGGYSILAASHEGKDYAAWLNGRGIAGIVVKYRVSSNPKLGYQYPVPFLDARRAIRTVRSKAAEWGIDQNKIGVMGSSAGGHLASLCSTRWNDKLPAEGKDEIDSVSCKPDFSILIYPVISMNSPIGHGGSRRNLLGDSPTQELADFCSTAQAVTKDSPVTFIVTTSDDPVDCRNSLEYATQCKAQGVPISLHLFLKGGHGYGLKGKGDVAEWPELLDKWLTDL